MNTPSSDELTISWTIEVGRSGKQKCVRTTDSSAADVPHGRIPRLTRLMALAITMQQMIRDGQVRDYAELARLGQVSRARISQIMNLLNLAPQIQEAILYLPRVTNGRDPVREHHVRSIAAVLDWREQRRLWGVIPTADGGSLVTACRDVVVRLGEKR